MEIIVHNSSFPSSLGYDVSKPILRHCGETSSFFPSCRPNLGRARNVPDQQVKPLKVHRSVKMRMEVGTVVPAQFDTGNLKDYQPKLKFEALPTWVD